MDERKKQVQVRLSPEIHRQLKSALALEDKKLVDFFNEAAIAYLSNHSKYMGIIDEIIGGDYSGQNN